MNGDFPMRKISSSALKPRQEKPGTSLRSLVEGTTLLSATLTALPQRSEQPKISLHHAARDNHLEIVGYWIREFHGQKHKLNERDSVGYAPLHYATKFNRYSIMKKLVEAGAVPDIKTEEENFTPLHFAARYTPRIVDEDTECNQSVETDTSKQAVEFLVQKEVQMINSKAQFGLTPLHLACQRGNLDAVTTLLECESIDIYAKDDNEDTPLHEACLNGHSEVVSKLLDRMKHNDITLFNPLNSEHKTPLHFACHEGHAEVVRMLVDHIQDDTKVAGMIETKDIQKNTALHLACESGVVSIVSYLVAKGADLLALRLGDVSAIHVAARYGFVDIAGELLRPGQDIVVNRVDYKQQTPLHYAAAHNKVEMIEFLFDNGADVAATDTESYTPLMVAAAAGHAEAFDILLRMNSAIDDVEKEGKTILHMAAMENHKHILQATLKNAKGARLVNSTDSSYNTALHLAAAEGNIEVVRELLKSPRILTDAKNELKKTPTHLAATKGHGLVVEALLRHKRECVSDEDEDGNTPLHLASLSGHHRTVKILLDFQADIHSQNATLWTPLNCAAWNGHEKVVQVLLEVGAEVNPIEKHHPTTPLHLAAQEGHVGVVKVLLEHNADVGKCCHNGLNSLDVAIDNGHQDIAMLIVKSEHWKSALKNTSKYHEKVTTPLRKLIKKMPDVAAQVFNQCSVSNETKDGKIRHDSKEYTVTFNYEFIEDFQDAKGSFFSRLHHRHRVDVPDTLRHTFSDPDLLSLNSKDWDSQAAEMAHSNHYDEGWGPVGFNKKLHPISIMVQNNRTNLLRHPLIISLLDLKWRTFGRFTYFPNLLTYVIFVTSITTFALLSLNPQSDTCIAVHGNIFGNTSEALYINTMHGCNLFTAGNISELQVMSEREVCDDAFLQEQCGVPDYRCGKCEGLDSTRRGFLLFTASVVIVIATIRLLIELFQLLSLKLIYLLSWVNWVEMILFPSAIIFVSVYNAPCLCPTRWQWQVGVIAMFLTWIDLIIFIQKLPFAGIYVLMFVHIFYTFCKAISLTLLLIFAFSFAFYMTFYDPGENFLRSSFATPGRSIVTTMTMTTGDFEYDAIFRQITGGTQPGEAMEEIPFISVSFILWILFLALMPVLLQNLLVGLAVDDIKGIQDAAVLQRLALQVELVLSVEELLPTRLRRFFIKEQQTVKPNRKLNLMENIRFTIFNIGSGQLDRQEYISNALHPQQTLIEQVQTQTRNLMQDVAMIKETTSDQAERIMMMEKLIQKMASKLGVDDTKEQLSQQS